MILSRDDFKHKKVQKIEKNFWEEKKYLLNLEGEVLKNHPRPNLYHQILMSTPKIFDINQNDDFTQQNKSLFKRNTKDKVLEGRWLMKWITRMTQNLKVTF